MEYPEIVAMMLREVYYGLEITLQSITLDPFGVAISSASLSNDASDLMFVVSDRLSVRFTPTQVQLTLPTLESRMKTWTLTHLRSNTTYTVFDNLNGERVIAQSDNTGVLKFSYAHNVGGMVTVCASC